MDIVERLRVRNAPYGTLELMDKAADEIERLRRALQDAHGLIDNDLVIPWIMAHKLDDVLIAQCSR